jgi:uncharacterized protein YdhG (YjbR/CyaY superfamily)
MQATKFKTVDEYIGTFPPKTKSLLKEMRQIIKKAAPKAEEVISYNMPAYKLNGPLVYFAGYNHHIGFYPTGSGTEAFKKEISKYETSKGTIRLPLDEPLPVKLISDIVKFRIAANAEKLKVKTNRK